MDGGPPAGALPPQKQTDGIPNNANQQDVTPTTFSGPSSGGGGGAARYTGMPPPPAVTVLPSNNNSTPRQSQPQQLQQQQQQQQQYSAEGQPSRSPQWSVPNPLVPNPLASLSSSGGTSATAATTAGTTPQRVMGAVYAPGRPSSQLPPPLLSNNQHPHPHPPIQHHQHANNGATTNAPLRYNHGTLAPQAQSMHHVHHTAPASYRPPPPPSSSQTAPQHRSTTLHASSGPPPSHHGPHPSSQPPQNYSRAPPQQSQQHHQQQQQQQHPPPQSQPPQQPSNGTHGHHAANANVNHHNNAPQPQPQQTMRKRVQLTPEAREALTKAVLCAIRTGSITPDLMKEALKTGLPQSAILQAANMARERERRKREARMAAGFQLDHTTNTPISSSSSSQPPQPSHSNSNNSQSYHHSKSPSQLLPATGNKKRSTSPTYSSTQQPHQQQQQQQPPQAPRSGFLTPGKAAAKLAATQKAKAVAAARPAPPPLPWNWVQSGIFLHKEKGGTPCAANSSLGPSVVHRHSSSLLALRPSQGMSLAKASGENHNNTSVPSKVVVDLLNPEAYRRIKIQPKKEAKALEKQIRKARTLAGEALAKQHKELCKMMVSHQVEFFKFHRGQKTERSKLARSIRDVLDKKDKKEKKDADHTERARLAALRANDMEAYTSLVEETKNERLKFLLGKTDECMSQISSLLQKQHDHEDGNDDGDDEGGDSILSTRAAASAAGSYYSSAHIKSEEVRQPGILVGGDLKEYQVAGLQWLVSLYNNRLSGVLADEMGLGKTVQAIALIAYLMEVKENLGPFLVIVPLSTLSNWVNEFAKWCPAARVVIYKGNPQQRKELYKEEVKNGHFNVLLTTYEYIIKDKASLRKITWQYAIVDEGHRMKNAQSKFSIVLGTMYTTRFRVLLTGTPLQNNLPELWALLNFLLPSIFSSADTFDQWFNKPFAQFGSASAVGTPAGEEDADNMLSNEERMLIIHRLHELLRPFMLRRVKSEVLDQLPEKVEKVLRCDLSAWQKELYKQISASVVTPDKTTMEQPSRGLNNVVMQLRKVCNHPYLFNPEGYHINQNIVRCSGKFELLDRMLPKLKAAGHRVLMFTQMTAVMTILEDYFTLRGYANLRLDGSTPADEREKRMYKFNAPDSPYFVFVLSTRAGGLGLNLATADTVIIFDSDWNPMMDLQAQDRAHRIGQRNDVRVFRLITNSPVEEKILSRATEKLNMSELVVEAGKFDKSSVENDNSLERKKLMQVLLTDFETAAAEAGESSNPTPSDTSVDGGTEDDMNEDDGDAEEEGDGARDELNELISTNENDYQLYCDIDRQNESQLTLFTDPNDLPDWVRYPNGKKPPVPKPGEGDGGVDGDSSRRTATKNVTYDDGLTERQFLRLVEKEAKGEEDAVTARKQNRKLKLKTEAAVDNPVAVPAVNNGHVVTPQSGKRKRGIKSPAKPQQNAPSAEKNRGDLTDWTHRKLINACKAVVAVREPITKRKLSDIFMEKPCPATYPDYYQLIQTPIAINDILRKCKDSLYSTIAEFRDDWNTMFANARKYNAEGTWIWVDAGVLESELDRIMDKNSLKDSAIPAPAPAAPSVKKKPLRIKLSLKLKMPAKAPEITQNASTSDSSSASSMDTNDASSVDSD
eukprot:scaffold421190_cov50-Attheya_sp.AAC.2